MYDAYIKASPVTQLIWGMMGTQPFLATDAPKLAPQGGALGGSVNLVWRQSQDGRPRPQAQIPHQMDLG